MRTKIYYNLIESKYKFNYADFEFYFSSKLYLNNFIKKINNYVSEENIKLRIKYNCDILGINYFALTLYKKIEKRGFRVIYRELPIKPNHQFIIV